MKELERYPFFGPVLRKLDLVLFAVSGERQGRTSEVIEGALRLNAEGRPMIIFPEATLMSLGAKERYRSGVGHIYQAMGVDAVLVASSLGVIWPRREWNKHAHQSAAHRGSASHTAGPRTRNPIDGKRLFAGVVPKAGWVPQANPCGTAI